MKNTVTKFMKKQFDAVDAFQKEMDKFNMNVDRSCLSGTYSEDRSTYNMGVRTVGYPIKGNKKLIEALKAAGYMIWDWCKYDRGTGRRYFMFAAAKRYAIQLAEDDAEEYKEAQQEETAEGFQHILENLAAQLQKEAIEAAGRMNNQAKTGDVLRNHTNYGAVTQALRTLRSLGFEAENATWGDGDMLICEKITVNGTTIYKREG